MAFDNDPLADHPVHDDFVRPGTKKEAFDQLMKDKEFEQIRMFKCSCGYEFKEKEGKVITRCPYCGRGANAFEKKASAQDILDDDY